MATTLKLPPYIDIAKVNDFCSRITNDHGTPIDNEIVFDFDRVKFVNGAGVTVLANAFSWLLSYNVALSCQNLDLGKDTICYLDDCGFFSSFFGGPLRPNAKERSTTIPMQLVTHDRAHAWLENTFSRWASEVFQVPTTALSSLRAALKELFHNINDHSLKTSGFIHAQYYPNKKVVEVTVSDFGRGIPSTVRQVTPDLDDAETIVLAVKKGYSVKSKPNNMGVGLGFLIDQVHGVGGTICILSYRGRVWFHRKSQNSVVAEKETLKAFYPGTLVHIVLPVATFIGDDDEEGEISWQ
jgi:anti-sigma regulatory factor (Ser/Thr protein kinase)